jgi:large subunit ribosomal protein L19
LVLDRDKKELFRRNKMNIVDIISKELVPENRSINFEVGDTVKVHYKIVEGNRERVQVYEGTVIAINNKQASKTFTVRRISYDIGVERVFPLFTPRIAKIEVVRKAKVRKSKLYFLRERTGKSAKLRERLFQGKKSAKKSAEPVAVAPKVEEQPAVEESKTEESAE